jgi:protein gp37
VKRVTTENQKEAERRVPILLQTPAAVRFIAAEPLLSAVDLKPEWLPHAGAAGATIDWVMAGGESGPNARPVALDWVRALRDQCARSATPFYWNGCGALMPDGQTAESTTPEAAKRYLEGCCMRRFRGRHERRTATARFSAAVRRHRCIGAGHR